MGTASWFAWDGPSLGTNNASEMGRITQRRQKSGGEWAGEGSGDRKWLSGRTSGRPERTLGVSAWELGLQVWSFCRNSRSLIYKVCAHPTLAATSLRWKGSPGAGWGVGDKG